MNCFHLFDPISFFFPEEVFGSCLQNSDPGVSLEVMACFLQEVLIQRYVNLNCAL